VKYEVLYYKTSSTFNTRLPLLPLLCFLTSFQVLPSSFVDFTFRFANYYLSLLTW
jgi:hypothetical protein